MGGVFFTLFIAISTLWVYWDAVTHKIGKTEGGGFTNVPAGGWAAATFGLWIIGFPLYLIKRNELIQKAKEHPAPEVKNFTLVFLVLMVLGGSIVALNWYSYQVGLGLPACDSVEVKKALKDAINNSVAMKLIGTSIDQIDSAGERSYDATKERRVCRANIASAAGNIPIYYSVDWQNKSENMFWVQTLESEDAN